MFNIKVLQSAIEKMKSRNWENIYFCIDLHETVFHPNYNTHDHIMYGSAIFALQYLSTIPYIKLIFWSSMSNNTAKSYIDVMKHGRIRVDYFNENPEVTSSKVADFSVKFYYNILLDDKAGFDPDTDWEIIVDFFKGL